MHANSPASLCRLLASRRLLRVHVCRVRQHTPQAAPPDQMCHPVSPGRLLSQRRGPAASAPFNEEISIIGPRGHAVLTGGMEARHRGNQETWTSLVSSPQTLFLPQRVTFGVGLPLLQVFSPHSRQPACQMITTRRDGFSSTGLLTSCSVTRGMLMDSQLHYLTIVTGLNRLYLPRIRTRYDNLYM